MDPDPYNQSLLLFIGALDTQVFLYIALLIFLFMVSALMSGSEIAFFSLSKSEIEEFKNSNNLTETGIARLMNHPDRLLATILIANNFVNIAIVLIFEYLLRTHLLFVENDIVRIAISVVLTSFMLLLFGEIVPKVYATGNYKRFSKAASLPLSFTTGLLRIFTAPFIVVNRWLEKILSDRKKTTLSVDSLGQALEYTNDNIGAQDEKRILEGIVTFGKTEAKQVMTPRTEMFTVSDHCPFDKLKEMIVKEGYSRIPVYNQDTDHIVGVLYIKDLLAHLDKEDFKWQKLLREPLFVPEKRKIDDILVDFQEEKKHLAIVVDEYGGTSGIISMDDILEEIVGNISDEFDEQEISHVKHDDTHFTFEGNIQLKDFYRILDLSDHDEQLFEDNKGEADSLAGFILEINGAFPKRGQKICFHKYCFTVTSADRKRIKRVNMSIEKK